MLEKKSPYKVRRTKHFPSTQRHKTTSILSQKEARLKEHCHTHTKIRLIICMKKLVFPHITNYVFVTNLATCPPCSVSIDAPFYWFSHSSLSELFASSNICNRTPPSASPSPWQLLAGIKSEGIMRRGP